MLAVRDAHFHITFLSCSGLLELVLDVLDPYFKQPKRRSVDFCKWYP